MFTCMIAGVLIIGIIEYNDAPALYGFLLIPILIIFIIALRQYKKNNLI